MRIPLIPAASFGASLDASISIPGLPLAFIDDEPFLIELQGVLELPGGGRDGERGGMEDVKVGNLDLSEPVSSGVRRSRDKNVISLRSRVCRFPE